MTGCDPYGVVEECGRNVYPGSATPGYGDGYAPHTSRMRIPADAGEYDSHLWKYKRIRRPQICCTPEEVQRKLTRGTLGTG